MEQLKADASTHIAFFGLGRMGSKMCRLLLEAGCDVTGVIHIHEEPARTFAQEQNFTLASSTVEAVRGADIVFTMLPADPEVSEVLFDERLAEALKPGAVVVDLSSDSRSLMEELAWYFGGYEIPFIDCPVSGPAGSCMMMASGDKDVIERIRPILEVLGGEIVYCGKAGTGSFFKSLNNLMLMVNALGAAEAAEVMRENPDLDPELFAYIVTNSSGYSRAFENSFLPFFINSDDSVSHEFWSSCKDMKNGLDEIKKAPVPMFSLAYQLLRLNFKHDHENWSSFIKLYRGE